MNNWIKLLGPSCSQEEIKAVTKVLKSGWWGQGRVCEELEKEFTKFIGIKYAVSLNSGTAALHLSLKVVKKKKRGKIIVPAFTFVASALVGLYENLEVTFGDIEEKSFCLDPNEVKRKIDKNTVAIIPVHYAGRLADMNYGKIDIPIIEDCAHAVGTPGAGKTGLLSCFSFHPVKNIATGDGGMVTTNNKEMAERIKRLRWFGINFSTYDREKKGYNWEYFIEEIGYKYHLNDILASIALTQLKKIRTLNEKRKKIAEIYNRELKNLPIILPPDSGSWHLYVVRVPKKLRGKLVEFLRQNKISPGVHYKPLYYYKIFGYDQKRVKRELSVTEKIWQEVISLPIYPDLKEIEQEKVISCLKKFFYQK